MSHISAPESRDPADSCLPDLLWEQARERPAAIAVVGDSGSLTFRALAQRSLDVAGRLLENGAAPDDIVGIFAEPSLDLPVAVWGILSAGCAYLPLSPEYPDDRLRYMVSDARVKTIVTQRHLLPRLAGLVAPDIAVLAVEDTAGPSGIGPLRPPETGLRPDHLAYVIYTSGSTGRPKGVMLEHRGIVSQLRWLAGAHGLGKERTVLQRTPMSFDAAQWEILASGCGSKIVVAAPGHYRDPVQLTQTIVRERVSTVQCVPTLLQALCDVEEFAQCGSLTQVFSGGEALSRGLARRCLDLLPGCDLINLYGPTECTINSSSHTVDRASLADAPAMIPIGTAVHGTELRILGADGAPVAVGEIGELYIGGVQLARGYLHRPDLTAQRFVSDPDRPGSEARLYRTGDLASWNADGTAQFAGRVDRQVKLRGYRVELEEIRLAIEEHEWVANAGVVVKDDPATGFQNLVAFIELDTRQAAVMDQGMHGAHHQSKENKLQVKAQLANSGCRDAGQLRGKTPVELPGLVPTPAQRERVFARKTYRYYDGGVVRTADITRLLDSARLNQRPAAADPRGLHEIDLGTLGEILRYFGQHHSSERLLPKYGYASPGSLYATQIYLEADGVAGLPPGWYYYHPVEHRLFLITPADAAAEPRLTVHFMGHKQAIEPVYTTNIREVLQIEAGHAVGLFEQILPAYGLDIKELSIQAAPGAADRLEGAADDIYLGAFAIGPYAGPPRVCPIDFYVQSHPDAVADLPAGQYRYRNGRLERISADLVLRRHVVAINQEVYDRASVGVAAVSRRRGWPAYVDLGRALHRLQANDAGFGFMSCGYSSETGRPLPAARRLDSILRSSGLSAGPSYFFVGGAVTAGQVRSEGMREDLVHMRGPAEILRDDLAARLPDYMVPNRIVVLDELPLTVSGKVDHVALESVEVPLDDRPFTAPRTRTEEWLARIWCEELKQDRVSVHDDFFARGGNSLVAVALVNKLNQEFGAALPVQVLFDAPTVAALAKRVDADGAGPDPSDPSASRLVRLWSAGTGRPVFCWPGLGGSVMNLRLLARTANLPRLFHGVQAFGLNAGEQPYPTMAEMAAHDVREIRAVQPAGPYTLLGYSFGARVALEAARQLERAGEQVDRLVLIAPGSPHITPDAVPAPSEDPMFGDLEFVAILFSVFTASVTDPALKACLDATRTEADFVRFVSDYKGIDPDLARRIVAIVRLTYQLTPVPGPDGGLAAAPAFVLRANGDAPSFLEKGHSYLSQPPTVIDLEADHYAALKPVGVRELAAVLRSAIQPSKNPFLRSAA